MQTRASFTTRDMATPGNTRLDEMATRHNDRIHADRDIA